MSRMESESVQSEAAGIGQNIKDMGSKAKGMAQEQFEQLRNTASEYYQQGRQKLGEWEDSLEQYVREQPMKSLLIAAGVGALLGILWRRS